jgi:soluble lytic murein transglycosylase-like protein
MRDTSVSKMLKLCISLVCSLILFCSSTYRATKDWNEQKKQEKIILDSFNKKIEENKPLAESYVFKLVYNKNKYDIEGYVYIPKEYQKMLITIAKEYDVPYTILARVADCESNWCRLAIGGSEKKGYDLGIMQLNTKSIPYFEKHFNNGKKIDPFNPEQSMRIAAMYLKDLYKSNNNNYYLAVASYNCGLSRVKKHQIPKMTYKYISKVFRKPLDTYKDLI